MAAVELGLPISNRGRIEQNPWIPSIQVFDPQLMESFAWGASTGADIDLMRLGVRPSTAEGICAWANGQMLTPALGTRVLECLLVLRDDRSPQLRKLAAPILEELGYRADTDVTVMCPNEYAALIGHVDRRAQHEDLMARMVMSEY